MLTSPLAGIAVVEGETLPLSADAQDNVRVASVQFTVNGVPLPLATTPPFSISFTVPLGIQTLTVTATATDNLGQIATATRTANVIPDPGTTVVGRIVDQNRQPLGGALVTCAGISGTTAADGTFSIAGVPTLHSFACRASVVTLDGSRLTATLVNISPVRGGTTSVGERVARNEGALYPGQRFAAGLFPLAVAVVDLNGDGHPDLIVANSRSNDVSVLLGTGDGTFQPELRFATGRFPFAVAVADVNGDGLPDLVTANTITTVISNDVSVLLGRGDGTFEPEQRFGAGALPLAVAVGDFNGDGLPDLVTANGYSNDVSLLLQLHR